MTVSTSTRFDRDTTITPLGDGAFEARLDRGWWIVRGPNGGYLTAILTRACEAAVDDAERHARSLTVHFLRPPAEGAVHIETEILRAGRSLSTVSARVVQDGRLQATAIAAFSKSRTAPGFEHAVMPEVSPPEALPPGPAATASTIPMRARFEQRWAIGAPPWQGGSEALAGGWIRLIEPQETSAAVVSMLADAWSPAVFSHFAPNALSAGVPTVDLSVHFREPLPSPRVTPGDWLLTVFKTRVARDGFAEEDGEIWTRDGLLLAQSRQMAVLA